MDLLIHQDVFKRFFFRDSAELLSETDVLLFNIFNNKSAKIILNKELSQDLLVEAKSDKKKKIIKRFIEHLKSQNRILSIVNTSIFDNLSEIKGLYKVKPKASQFLIVISDEKDETIDADNYIALKDENVLEKNTPQYNTAQIAAHNRLTIRHLDFKNNTEVYNFFRQIFNFVPFSEVIIIDRYLNFLKEWTPFDGTRSYAIFENLKNKKFLIYTFNAENKDFISGSLNDFCTRVSTDISIFSTSNPSIIHERKLFFHHFIIETDEDLASIHANRETWKVDIHYDKKLSETLQSKLQNFIPFQVN